MPLLPASPTRPCPRLSSPCEAAGVLIVACDDPLKDGDDNKLAPWFGIDAYNIGYAAGEWMADYATENNMTEDETVGVLYMTMNTTSSCVPVPRARSRRWLTSSAARSTTAPTRLTT